MNQSPSLLALDLPPLTGFSTGFTSPTSQTPSGFADLFSRIFAVMTIFAGIAFAFWFAIGAFTWITGGGDPQQLEKAKKQMSSALVGLFVVVLIFPLTYILSQLLGLDILNLEALVEFIKPQ